MVAIVEVVVLVVLVALGVMRFRRSNVYRARRRSPKILSHHNRVSYEGTQVVVDPSDDVVIDRARREQDRLAHPE
jgi:hypothetical protein